MENILKYIILDYCSPLAILKLRFNKSLNKKIFEIIKDNHNMKVVISKYVDSQTFVDNHKDIILVKYVDWTYKFKYLKNYIDFSLFWRKNNISQKFLINYNKNIFNKDSIKDNIVNNVIDWNNIFNSSFNFSDNFIENNIDKVSNFDYLIRYQKRITEAFIEKYSHLINDWDNVFFYRKLSDSFIIKYYNKINSWYDFFRYNFYLSEKIIYDFIHKIKFDWSYIWKYQKNISEKFIEENIFNITNWDDIWKYRNNLSFDFVKKYINYVKDYNDLLRNNNIPDLFIENVIIPKLKNINYLFLMRDNLSNYLMNKYQNQLNNFQLILFSKNNINTKLIEDNIHKINDVQLILYTQHYLSEEFILKYKKFYNFNNPSNFDFFDNQEYLTLKTIHENF